MSTTRPVLIVDAMNLFVRSYSAYPTMSAHGYQMGGCIGFLKTLRRIVFESQPKAVYICWEGGGSTKRRRLYSEYKMNRKPEKLNRFYEDDIPDSDDNKKYQIEALLHMTRCVPVCQLYVSDCEGDDLVAYLCRGPMRAEDKIIVSSDKDLYQLLDDQTKVYSLHKKTFVTKETVMEEFRVQAKHFALAKALCGDNGDNVPGIKGVGFKTVASCSRFWELMMTWCCNRSSTTLTPTPMTLPNSNRLWNRKMTSGVTGVWSTSTVACYQQTNNNRSITASKTSCPRRIEWV